MAQEPRVPEIERIRADLYPVLSRLNGAWEHELSPHWHGVDAPHRGPSRSEPGRVNVLGHSDNQPIRTVRFPSNFQLSAARADAARVVLAGATAQAAWFTSVGRADTEPLVPNDTAENRDANRPIEIVLALGEGR